MGVNLIAGGNDAFRIAFDRLDVGETQSAMDYEIMLNGNASLVRGGAIAPSATPFSVTLPFSSFGANWPTLLSNVSSIDFRFNPSGARNVDYELTSLQAVPEPSALALLAVGVCGAVVMGCVRRRDVRKITT
jgi:hypothetical protein